MTTAPPRLSDAHKRALLDLARSAVVAKVTGAGLSTPALDTLPEASGVFVTLTRQGELRGCLGALDCRDGLGAEVSRCAGNAARHDPRFLPVSAAELAALEVEISVLGPLEDLPDPLAGGLIIGRHGLVIEQGRRRGLLLPQVASERGWTPEEFLNHTCRKAGLPSDAWRQTARVFRFEAEVFGDTRSAA